MKAGVIGLGLIGSQIATRLINSGQTIAVYNRNKEECRPFSQLSIQVANHPAELAKICDFIIMCVTDFVAVKELCFGNEGITACRNESSSIVSSEESTIFRPLLKKKIELLSMPFMGGRTAAEKGELVPTISGNKQAFEKVKPIIEKKSKNVSYIGSLRGSVNAIKLALNLNITLISEAIAKGILLVKELGLEPKLFIQRLNSTYFRTGISGKKGPKMIKNNFEPSFYLRNMVKDLELAMSAAQSIEISLPLTVLAQQIYRAANNSGFSEQDYTSIIVFLERRKRKN